MAVTKTQLKYDFHGNNRKSKYTKLFKRRMNKLYRQSYKQRNTELFKHSYAI